MGITAATLADAEGPPCAARLKHEALPHENLDQQVSLILGAEAAAPVPQGLMLDVA